MHGHVLQDLVVVLATSIVVVMVSARLRIPAIVAFLLTGTLLGPHGLALIADQASVELLAEVGVIVLLFAIGVELSLGEVVKAWRALLIGGGLQTSITAVATTGAALALGQPTGVAVLLGFIIALSSTAIVMRLLNQRAETSSAHGRLSLGILVFQDLAVVPMMLTVPFLARGGIDLYQIALTAGTAMAIVVALLVVSRKVVPRILHAVVGARSNELFLLTVLFLCLGTAWLTSLAGLSLALGAFLAGLVVSESEYSHQALGAILPFRDAFSSLFFVAIGMLLDVRFVVAEIGLVIAVTLAVLVGKTLVASGAVLALGYPARIALLTGALISQVGEFSFLLLYTAEREGVVGADLGQLIIAVAVLSMAATPAVGLLAPSLLRLGGDRTKPVGDGAGPTGPSDHVIIVGHGLNGHNVALALKAAGASYVILEVNPQTVRRLRREGEPITYGDATQPALLEHAGIHRARVLVVTIPDAASARRVVDVAHRLNPGTHIIVRTRLVGEVDDLFRIGAHEVVPEEFETSIELFSRVLRRYLVPRQAVEALARQTRQAGYDMFRVSDEGHRPVSGLQRLLGGVEMEAYGVEAGSAVAGVSLADARINRKTGAMVLAVHRNSKTVANPPADFSFEVDDVALLLGAPASLGQAAELFRTSRPEDPG